MTDLSLSFGVRSFIWYCDR